MVSDRNFPCPSGLNIATLTMVVPIVTVKCLANEVRNQFWIGLSAVEKDKFSVELSLSTDKTSGVWDQSSRLGKYGVTAAFGSIIWVNQWFHLQLLQGSLSITRVSKDHTGNDEATSVITVCPRIL